MEIKDFFRENIKNLAPYSTARDEYQGDIGIYIDANENPYDTGHNRYPDPYQKALKQRLSEIKQIAPDHIFIGNGSDEPIDLVYRVFCEPRIHNVVSIAPTYGMYRVAAAINDVEFREVQLEEGFLLDASKVLAAADSDTRVIFLCSPNNPSGNLLDNGEVMRIIENFNGIVVVDEAYVDFSKSSSLITCIDSHPNLIVLQTLSKAWGMAGLRLGIAYAAPLITETFTKVKYPYNINVLTQRTVLEKLSNTAKFDSEVAELLAERDKTAAELSRIPGIRRVFPSDSNFVLIKVDSPDEIYNALIRSGIIVRNRSKIRGCEGCLRITIGTPEENAKLIDELRKLLSNG